MSDVLVWVLLATVVATAAVSAAGLWLARDAFDRLHFIGPVAHLGGLALLAAVLVERGASRTSAGAVLVLVTVQLAAPIATHTTGRAGAVRGDLARLRSGRHRIVE